MIFRFQCWSLFNLFAISLCAIFVRFIILATVFNSLDTFVSLRNIGVVIYIKWENTSSSFGKMSEINSNVMRALFSSLSFDWTPEEIYSAHWAYSMYWCDAAKIAHRPKLIHFFGPSLWNGWNTHYDENETNFPNLFHFIRIYAAHDDDDDGRMAEIKLNRKQPYNINTLNYHRRHRHRLLLLLPPTHNNNLIWCANLLIECANGRHLRPTLHLPAPANLVNSIAILYSRFQLPCIQFIKKVLN